MGAVGPSTASQMQLRSNNCHGLANGACNGHPSSGANGNCRFDSSLNTLTKKFIDLIARAKDGILDLKTAEKELQARRSPSYVWMPPDFSLGCWHIVLVAAILSSLSACVFVPILGLTAARVSCFFTSLNLCLYAGPR